MILWRLPVILWRLPVILWRLPVFVPGCGIFVPGRGTFLWRLLVNLRRLYRKAWSSPLFHEYFFPVSDIDAPRRLTDSQALQIVENLAMLVV